MSKKPVQAKNRLSAKKFNRLALSSAVVMAMSGGYGRSAWAGTVTGAGPDFTATGPADSATDVTIGLSATGLSVTTEDGFGITTTAGNAFTLIGINGLTFDDRHASDITGFVDAIWAANAGGGDLAITVSGAVTGASGDGIVAYNGSDGVNLSITATGTVTGATDGIAARNRGQGSGDLTISVAGVTGSSGIGIDAYNGDGDGNANLSITATGAVTGATDGIAARNRGGGSGDLTISVAAVTGFSGDGIRARNSDYGVNLSITATGAVSGGRYGILADNNGSGELTVTAMGDVSGDQGIAAFHQGSGDLTITTAGAVSAGERGVGILANNRGSGATFITVQSGSSVTGGREAISTDISGNPDRATEDTVDISGSITGDINLRGGADRVDFAGQMSGDILLGAGADTVNIRGGLLNGQVIGTGEDLVTVDIGPGNRFISQGVVNVKDYVIRSGEVLQRGDFSAAGGARVDAGASLAFDGTVNGSGALESAGELRFIFGDDSAGQLLQDGVVTLNADSAITLSGEIHASQVGRSVVGRSVLLVRASEVIEAGVSFINDLSGSWGAAELFIGQGQVTVFLKPIDLSTVSYNRNIINFAAALDSAFASSNDASSGNYLVLDLLADVAPGDVAGFDAVLDGLAPSVSGAVAYAGAHANDATWRLLRSRLLANGDDRDGGNNGLWAQYFGGGANQQAIDPVQGFLADHRGLALGYDLELGKLRLGLALGRGEVSVDNDRAVADVIDVDSLQLSLYGRYSFGEAFLNASASFGRQDYHLARASLAENEQQIYGSTDGDLVDISLGGGYGLQLGWVVLTPSAQLRCQSLSIDRYRERGGLNLQVDYEDSDRFRTELGMTAAARYRQAGWIISPRAHLFWSAEHHNGRERLGAQLATGERFRQRGFVPDNQFIDLGLGLGLRNNRGLGLALDVQQQIGGDTDYLSASVSMRYRF